MDTSNHTHDKIGLRSEKVRRLIGEIPPSLIRRIPRPRAGAGERLIPPVGDAPHIDARQQIACIGWSELIELGIGYVVKIL